MEGSPHAESLSCSLLPGGGTEDQRGEGSELIVRGLRLGPSRKGAPGTCLGLLLCLRKKAAEKLGLRPDGGQPGHLELRELVQLSRNRVSCWEKQPSGSQQMAWEGRLVPEMCPLPLQVCRRGGQAGLGSQGPQGGPGSRLWPWVCHEAPVIRRNRTLSTG